MKEREITLSQAAIGRTYQIVRVAGPEPVKRRILEMGLLPGSIVKVLRIAPLGDPIEITAEGFPLTVRGSEAQCIIVVEVSA